MGRILQNPACSALLQWVSLHCVRLITIYMQNQGRFVERVLACSELFLPTAHQVCTEELAAAVDEDQEAVEDFLDCFQDTLDNMTAERCLAIVPDGSDTVDTLVEAALCLTEAKTNATQFIENFLGVEPGQQVTMLNTCSVL